MHLYDSRLTLWGAPYQIGDIGIGRSIWVRLSCGAVWRRRVDCVTDIESLWGRGHTETDALNFSNGGVKYFRSLFE